MSFQSKMNDLFPDVGWTGGSDIHVSFAMNTCFGSPPEPLVILKILSQKNAGPTIWRMLNKKFGKFEWLMTGEEFTSVFMVDCNNHLYGQGDSASRKKLTNPMTGNRFHRIALLGDTVGGVRFWCDMEGPYLNIGFRFRIERQDEEEEETRRRAREEVFEALGAAEEVMASLLEIGEPPKEKTTEISQFITTMEGG